jgi:hypothetical protein
VHTVEDVNQALTRGEYFWVDIARDGIALYELLGVELATPKPPTAADAYKMASAYLADWLGKVDAALEGAAFYVSNGHNEDAAFTLHQAAERAYTCFLLVRTHYVPRSHSLKFLRSLAEDRSRASSGADRAQRSSIGAGSSSRSVRTSRPDIRAVTRSTSTILRPSRMRCAIFAPWLKRYHANGWGPCARKPGYNPRGRRAGGRPACNANPLTGERLDLGQRRRLQPGQGKQIELRRPDRTRG